MKSLNLSLGILLTLTILLTLKRTSEESQPSTKQTSFLSSEQQQVIQIQGAIQFLQPSYLKEPMKAAIIADHIHKELVAKDIDWKIFLAILFQESSLKTDPQAGHSHQIDYGIGQINARTWKDSLKLDLKKLKTDPIYAISKTVKILANYKDRYAHKELNWYTRYHSGTPSKRAIYQTKLNKIYAKIHNFTTLNKYPVQLSEK